jgi:hypothetical protein
MEARQDTSSLTLAHEQARVRNVLDSIPEGGMVKE